MAYAGYHGNGAPWRGVVLAGMDAHVPAGLEYVNNGLHADVELGHPHHLDVSLWALHEAHLPARL